MEHGAGPTSRRSALGRMAAAAATAAMTARPSGAARAQPAGALERRSRVLVFDVNETLLDVGALRPVFRRIFGAEEVLREWFAQVLLYSGVATIVGPYADFGRIGGAALEMVARARNAGLAAHDKDEVLAGMRSLPPHPEVPSALRRLRGAGFRLVTLTNSPPQTVEAQLEHAGLREHFEQRFSVDAVQRYKPAPETYRFVADRLRLRTADLRLVAAHGWDVLGAMRAGCAAAFIARPGQVLFPLAPEPDIVGPDLAAVAGEIIRRG